LFSRRYPRLQYWIDNTLEKFSRWTVPILRNRNLQAYIVAANVITSFASLITFSVMSGGVLIAAGQLGAIRTAAPLFALGALITTVFLAPDRLLRTAGVVAALLVASGGWDAAVWLVHTVESRTS